MGSVYKLLNGRNLNGIIVFRAARSLHNVQFCRAQEGVADLVSASSVCAHAVCVCAPVRTHIGLVDWCGPDICPGECIVIWVGGCQEALFSISNTIFI